MLDDYAEQMTSLVKRDREFNSDVSHELRTPLAVLGMATERLLERHDLPTGVPAQLQQMRQTMPLKPALKAPMQPRPKRLRPPWPRPNPPSLLWRCVVMTVLAKRKQKLLQVGMAAVMADPVSAARVRVVTGDRAALASVAVNVVGTVLVTGAGVVKAVISGKTGVRVWAMPLSVPSARPWNAPKCRCANWPHKPMAKP